MDVIAGRLLKRIILRYYILRRLTCKPEQCKVHLGCSLDVLSDETLTIKIAVSNRVLRRIKNKSNRRLPISEISLNYSPGKHAYKLIEQKYSGAFRLDQQI